MDEKYLWPLIGVVLGWLLTGIATGWKQREENRKRVGKLLSKLMRINRQVKTLKSTSENFKDQVKTLEEFETFRSSISNRHFLEPESEIDKLIEAMDDISGIYPVDSQGMHILLELLLKSKNASLSSTLKLSEDSYIKMLSAYEVVLYACQTELEKNCKWLARKHSLVTYIRVRYWLRTKKVSQSNSDFMSGFSGELLEKMRESLNK